MVNYNLAEDQFWQPGEIDVLLKISAFTQIIKGRKLKQCSFWLTETTLGRTILTLVNKEVMQIRLQYASLTTKSRPLPNFGKSKTIQHFLQPFSLPMNWRALVNMTRQQHMVKMKGLKFDNQFANIKPFFIRSVRNGCPILENHHKMPSDIFRTMKTTFWRNPMPKPNTK